MDFTFIPPEDLARNSNIAHFMSKYSINDYEELIARARDIEWYWDAVNKDQKIEWFKQYSQVLDLSKGKPWAKWFIDGKCNIVHNCLDKHVKVRGNKPAYIWEGEDGSKRIITYNELYHLVNKLANGLSSINVRKGDVVTIYMPMIPEAIVAMLACSKIGAIHSVVFSGFTSSALAARINDANSKVLITADGYYRRGKFIDLKGIAEEAASKCKSIESIIVCRYASKYTNLLHREIWLDDLLKDKDDEYRCEVMNAEDPLFILYTSGTTGKPKGVLHVHGGFTVFAAQQAAYLIDQKENDILFWPADIGWITGQTWSVYGSLLLGSTSVIYDGAPDYPQTDRWFRMINEYNVTIFGASPTAIRLFMKHNIRSKCTSLRILASTGESLNPDEWFWYLKNVGDNRTPIINLSGGTEIGGAILSPLPIMPLKPSTVGGPVPGFDADVFDDSGKSVTNVKGYLVIKKPWPAMTRGLWNDPVRYIETYWSRFNDIWFHGDWASIEDNLWYLHGRVDDVIKVAGHRIGSAEIESVVSDHESVLEAAVISVPHEIKGESILIYVVLREGYTPHISLKNELKEYVVERIGKIARPEDIKFIRELPKTRTGKIIRRLIRSKLLNIELGDLSSLDNPESLKAIDEAI